MPGRRRVGSLLPEIWRAQTAAGGNCTVRGMLTANTKAQRRLTACDRSGSQGNTLSSVGSGHRLGQ
jgi:hypothetical protein